MLKSGKRFSFALPMYFLCISVNSYAEEKSAQWPELAYTVKAGLQYKAYNFDQSFSVGDASFKRDLEAYIPTLSVVAGAALSRFYLALKHEDALTSGSTGRTQDFSGEYTKNDIERRDTSLTFGCNTLEGLDVFVGWLDGETTLDTTSTIDEGFDESGPYAGLIYGWSVSDTGSIALNFAYADMDGEVKLQDKTGVNFEGGKQKVKGDSKGYSVALTWSAVLTDTLGYYVDLRYQVYSLDTNDGEFQNFELDEEIGTLTAGIQYFF